MTDDELAAIEARCKKATPGPWNPPSNYDHERHPNVLLRRSIARDVLVLVNPRYGRHLQHIPDEAFEQAGADAAFIAAARSDIPALLAEVRRLREIVAPFERLEAYRRSRATPGYDHEHPRQAVCRVCFGRAVIESGMYPRAEADKEPE